MNKSGIYPVEYKVLVLPDMKEEKTEGGIVLTSDYREKQEMAEVEGELIAVGPDAFTNDEGHLWSVKPQIGATVLFAKYAGIYTKGNDGLNYRLINDKDVLAIRERNNGN